MTNYYMIAVFVYSLVTNSNKATNMPAGKFMVYPFTRGHLKQQYNEYELILFRAFFAIFVSQKLQHDWTI